ncbi:hypothetical protein ABIF94_001180 [Bradyrhizobium ottawaense]
MKAFASLNGVTAMTRHPNEAWMVENIPSVPLLHRSLSFAKAEPLEEQGGLS